MKSLERGLNRRGFVRLAVLGTVGSLLAACQPSQIARAGVQGFTPNLWGNWSLTDTWIG